MTHAPSFVRPWQSRENPASGGNPSGEVVSGNEVAGSEPPQRPPGEDLLLRETNHRWSNDLQLVVGLLALQSRRTTNDEVRQALTDAMERVSVLSRARKAMYRVHQHSLDHALQQVCEALHVQAELRSISILLEIAHDARGLSERQITILALVVNELTTNAIKHAFIEGTPGHICISTGTTTGREVTVTVDDDGRPLAEASAHGSGIGMRLVKQLMASIGGVVISPPAGRKIFELRVPLALE